MEFMKKLIETEDSVRLREFSISSMEDGCDHLAYRLFERVDINERVQLSIQASFGHYCRPRKTVAIGEYSSMELAIFMDDDFVNAAMITDNEDLVNKLNKYYEGTVYACVPVELIERLYLELLNTDSL